MEVCTYIVTLSNYCDMQFAQESTFKVYPVRQQLGVQTSEGVLRRDEREPEGPFRQVRSTVLPSVLLEEVASYAKVSWQDL
jgi:hypothetical protein